MKTLALLSFLALFLEAAHSQNARTCASCHSTAGICTQKTGYVTCSCTSGYFGNGINCTPIASCTTNTCCSPGYIWDNRVGYKVCTDINECTDATLNKCVPSSTCTNKVGTFLCGNTKSVNCPSSACSYDLDCLGNVQCADPCLNYQLLNGTSRLSTINSTGAFLTDRYNFGWFRYNGTTGLRMQEGCIGSVKCGSAEPFTLNGSHPAIGEGVVMMTLLANTASGCTAAGTIPVKACSGGYYVYKFSGSLKSEVYCTDPMGFVIPTLPPTTTTTTTTLATTTTTPTTTTTTPTTTPATTTTTPTTTTTIPTTTTTIPTTTTTIPTTTTTIPTTTTTIPTTTTTIPTTTTTIPTTTTTIPTTTTTIPTTTTTIPTTTTTTPTTTLPTTTTTTPTTTTPTTTTLPTTTTTLTTTTTPLPTTTQPVHNITVTTIRNDIVISVTSSVETLNGTDVSYLEINETNSVYTEVMTINPINIIINIKNSVTPSYSKITVGNYDPVTFTNNPPPQNSNNETIVPNMQPFQLYFSTPPQTKTLTETFTINNSNVTSTTTTTTITTEEIIVID